MAKLALTGICLFAMPAHAAAGPSLSATTKVAGSSSPRTLASDGHWQRAKAGEWILDLTLAAPPMGSTTVASAWSSPVDLVRGRWFLASGVEVQHEGTADAAIRYSLTARLCLKVCEPWRSMSVPSSAQDIAVGTLPYRVSTGSGLDFQWTGKPATGRVEWRFSLIQSDGDEAALHVEVGTGAAAKVIMDRQ